MAPEYNEWRCCMCPHSLIHNHSRICPGIAKTLHPENSPCRFVKDYKDESGNQYAVVGEYDNNRFRIKCQVSPERNFVIAKKLPGAISRKIFYDFDKAQKALNQLAKMKGWEEFE